MKTYNRKKGKQGELIAEVFLKNQGYRIRDKNYLEKSGEIDLIVEKGQYIIFVEVKFRNNLDYGYPREAVTVSKQKRS